MVSNNLYPQIKPSRCFNVYLLFSPFTLGNANETKWLNYTGNERMYDKWNETRNVQWMNFSTTSYVTYNYDKYFDRNDGKNNLLVYKWKKCFWILFMLFSLTILNVLTCLSTINNIIWIICSFIFILLNRKSKVYIYIIRRNYKFNWDFFIYERLSAT